MPKFHVTKKAKNTTIDGCEFVNVDLVNDGENTKVFNSRFMQIKTVAKDWASKWWGQVVVGLIILIVAYFIGIK